MISNQKQIFLLGKHHCSNTNDLIEYKKVNPKNQKFVKFFKGNCIICIRSKCRYLNNYLCICDRFFEEGKRKHGHCSSMSKSALCDLNRKGDPLQLHDRGPTPTCECEQQIILTRNQFGTES